MEKPDFTDFNELAGQGSGGKILFATDDWFAAAENMIKDTEPIFIADKYTNFGKWMDGWETRRRRLPGHDWCIIKLGGAGSIKGFHVNTAFFTGNYAPKISVQAAKLSATEDSIAPSRKADMTGRAPSNRDFDKIARLKSNEWKEIVRMTELKPGYEETRHTFIVVENDDNIYTHVRLNIYPDGGVARFRVYGPIQLNLANHLPNAVLDLLALQNGGTCVSFSNAHYGHPRNLIKPGRGVNMGDGWETARRLDRPQIIEIDENGILNVPGSEWAIFKLGTVANIASIEVDTNHFMGNYPDNVKIEGTFQKSADLLGSAGWTLILDKQKLNAHKQHYYKKEILSTGPYNFVRITMAPDGGISRIRIFGTIYSGLDGIA